MVKTTIMKIKNEFFSFCDYYFLFGGFVMKKFVFSTIFVFALALILAACATAKGGWKDGDFSEFDKDPTNPVVCASRTVTSKGIEEAEDDAVEAARTALSEIVGVELASEYRKWRDTKKLSEDDETTRKQIERVTNIFTHEFVRGSVEKRKEKQKQGDRYEASAAVCLDYNTYKNIIKMAPEIEDEAKEALEADAETAFNRLAERMNKGGKKNSPIIMSTGKK